MKKEPAPPIVPRFELEDDGGGGRTGPRADGGGGGGGAPSAAAFCSNNDDDDDDAKRHYTLEQALDMVGTGPYQRLALLTTGLANAADAAEILAIGLVVPAAREALALDSHPLARSALTSCIFLGMLVGGLVFGPLGDRAGRRPTLALSLLLNGACGALSSLAPTAALLALARFCAGVGVGGSVPVVFAWMSELTPRASRGRWLVFLAAFWMVGSLFSATLGLLLIPRLGWRIFLLCATAPAFASAACAVFLMDESPRFLLVSGRPELAARGLLRAARMNRRPVPARGFALAPLPMPPPPPQPPASSAAATARLWAALLPFRRLLSPPLRAHTWPMLLGMAGISGGWYSLILWLPTYFERRGARVGAGLYAQTLAVSAANLPGNVASALMIDKVGRRITACGAMALAGAAALAFALAPATPGAALAAACVFNGVSVAAWNALDCLGAELFPTAVRSSAVGLLGASGRLASFAATAAAGWLTEVSLAAPLVVAAALLAAGSAAMLRLPEPALQPLEDSIGGEGGGGGGAMELAAVGAGGGGGRGGGGAQALAAAAAAAREGDDNDDEEGGQRRRVGGGAGGVGAGAGAGAREEEEGAALLGGRLQPLSSLALMR